VIEWIDISVPAVSHQQGADELVFKSPCCWINDAIFLPSHVMLDN
jgi:hypothetical protein